jgi:PHD/YefM family antitoxin component YafN of YafNO toxin-antitoxin module
MQSILSPHALDAFVPISRFNRGEASKIFDEVQASGCKIVVKNNTPACVMLAPDMYRKIMEMVEDDFLVEVAEARLAAGGGTTAADEVYRELGIAADTHDEIPMEYGVDFA